MPDMSHKEHTMCFLNPEQLGMPGISLLNLSFLLTSRVSLHEVTAMIMPPTDVRIMFLRAC